jgi:hypothetical protein
MSKETILNILMFLLGVLSATLFANKYMEKHSTIVNHGAAYYDPQTGQLIWIDEG